MLDMIKQVKTEEQYRKITKIKSQKKKGNKRLMHLIFPFWPRKRKLHYRDITNQKMDGVDQ